MAENGRPRRAEWLISHGEPVYPVSHARAAVRGNSTVDADLVRLEKLMSQTGHFTITRATVAVGAWRENEYGVEAVIPVAGMTAATLPLVYIMPDTYALARQAGVGTTCVSGDGRLTVYARLAPQDTIRLAVIAMFSQETAGITDRPGNVEVTDPDVPALVRLEIPVASKDTLGGVRIGDNIEILEDGTISAKPGGCNHILSGGIVGGSDNHKHNSECMSDLLASEDEVNAALNRALGIDALPGYPDASQGQTGG